MKATNTSWKPTLEDVLKMLGITESEGKLKGLINNCLQMNTKRLPLEKDSIAEI